MVVVGDDTGSGPDGVSLLQADTKKRAPSHGATNQIGRVAGFLERGRRATSAISKRACPFVSVTWQLSCLTERAVIGLEGLASGIGQRRFLGG